MDSIQLNSEATTQFKNGNFRAAEELYRQAIYASGDSIPLTPLLSNLSATLIKLGEFDEADHAARDALRFEPRAIKPRYRRGVARREMGFFAEALIDFASVLVIDPTHSAAISAFNNILTEFPNRIPSVLPEDMMLANFPPAYGSVAACNAVDIESTLGRQRSPPPLEDPGITTYVTPSNPHHLSSCPRPTMMCSSCKAMKFRTELKTCKRCKTVSYCNQQCQRANWPQHKADCQPSTRPVIDRTLRIGRSISEVPYVLDLLRIYAMIALGFQHHSKPPCHTALMVIVGLVPMFNSLGKRTRRKRLSLLQLMNVPFAILPDDMISGNEAFSQANSDKRGLFLLIVPDTTLKDEWATRTRGIYCSFNRAMLADIQRPDYTFEIYSRARQANRMLTSDLNLLHVSIEDELAMDFDNFYHLQR
ncbi:hypothetical protein R3P38DRAFT_756440 [Favolaschia claudopus]|uniref:MYND-type domain-containing protein n=1 Tax=Favolaschia claudopus TaxID=2862362 RepID=A0AAV9Z3G8_9AGAR